MSEKMLKVAYRRGLERALEEYGVTKEAALWGTLAAAGKGLWKGLSKVTPGGGDALGFGLFGGGLGALSAEPGSRLEGFGKGFGAGLVGGAGWHYGTKGANKLIGGLAKSKTLNAHAPGLGSRMQQVMGIGSKENIAAGPMTFKGIWGDQGRNTAEAAKLFGAKSLVAVPTLGAAFGLSGAAEDAAHKYIPGLQRAEESGYEDIPRYVSMGRDILRAPRMGLTPPGVSSGAYSGTMPGARTW